MALGGPCCPCLAHPSSEARGGALPSRYCAGTMPWGHPGEHHDFEPQRHDDGYLEVIGFTMTSLVSKPAGGPPGALGLPCPWPWPRDGRGMPSLVVQWLRIHLAMHGT